MMAAPEPGSEIDGFRLGELMHVGTMAWVYRLIGPDGPLPLIMKIPRLGAGERAMNVVSFEQCRLVLGALAQGPHYPTLVAYGDVETTPYLLMEYIEGERLNEWTRRAPVQPQEIARIGAAVALALHEIHRQDVIHLDLKSTNILFRHDGKAALVDFGLSHHGHYPDLLAEEFRYPVGNWEYMSPEQIFGIRCDPRSDIFSFGALLYELATGQLPFGSPQSLSQLRGRLYRDAIPPAVRVAAVPAWLQEIILHCLEIDNRKRYESAERLAFDLANPSQVALGERASRNRRTAWSTTLFRRMSLSNFAPAPCPALAVQSSDKSIVLVAIDCMQGDERLFEARRDAVRRKIAADDQCRVACAVVVPPAAALEGEGEDATATGRHIKHAVMLRQWAKPLELPDERLTYHVLESDKPALALVDYATANEVDEILIGAPHRLASVRLFLSVAETVVRDAPCSVKVVRARPPG
jgi:nucleotide-binding universal stress UspA family protein